MNIFSILFGLCIAVVTGIIAVVLWLLHQNLAMIGKNICDADCLSKDKLLG